MTSCNEIHPMTSFSFTKSISCHSLTTLMVEDFLSPFSHSDGTEDSFGVGEVSTRDFDQVLSTGSFEASNDRCDFQFYEDLESDDVWGKSGPLACDSRGSGAVPDGSKFFNFF
ncbi:Hypothetical protein NCS54_01492400 [Fusarium falciforme]|uniref:Hypothetical protein n=1 Tax=Fusarium falciforme TaxID=195108 RepID=UPI002300FA01|nr:Hypothetical protein NCS54_01492400 [Fusarium falciforme]WAO97209.1 Hypothetical protein NCS54_01492400 [Fusarium falciforme]